MSLVECSVQWDGRLAVIRLPAEIDLSNADQVSRRLLQILDEDPAALVVDMTATAFCDSSGMHMLSRARWRAAVAGAALRVAASSHAVRRILELTGMDQLIDIYPSLDTALASLPAEGDGGGEAVIGSRRRVADRQRESVRADVPPVADGAG